jgi:excisionase family DNA binding protein
MERYVSAQIARPAIRGEKATLGEAMSGRDPDPDQLLTPSEVAALFRVDPKTVTRWAKAGKLTSIRTLGGHRRYRATEVHALLDAQSGSRGAETVAPDASHVTPPGGFPPR